MGVGGGIGRRAGAALALASAAAVGAAAAEGPRRPLLAQLEPGTWQLRASEGRTPVAALCIADPDRLLQLQHGAAPCSRLVISADSKGGTVHYTCPSTGFGRTTVRVETGKLAVIESQGIHNGVPFAFRAEARRVGPCAPGQRRSAGNRVKSGR